MLVRAGREILREDFHGRWVRNLRHNGGYNTLQDWQMEEERFQSEWLNFLDKLPEVEEYVNIDGFRIHLSHAGFTPRTFDQFETDFLWDRDHFQDKWDSINFPRMIVVHGHTPNCYVDDEINPASDVEIVEGAYWYCDNHKICLDTGAVWSDVAVLLDLDDFTEYIIKGENE
jgi:hypothetical protein